MNSNSLNSYTRQWWVVRWLELLDSYRFKKRLERARNYAREGNVLKIEFDNAQVIARVQGSETEPYQVSLAIEAFTPEDWQNVIATMAEKAIFLAQLLAGEMPENIESVFTANGLSLFPFTLGEVHSRCSCPDAANPCKHIGAVYYQLADRFSENPFVIFQLRGKSKSEIIADLLQLWAKEGDHNSIISSVSDSNSPEDPDEATTQDLRQFWRYDEPLDPDLVVITPPVEGKTVLDYLGGLPLPTAEAEIVEKYLAQVYQTIPLQAMQVALGD